LSAQRFCYQREKEVDAIRMRPHAYEFALYEDV
jgi:hypothetical protein